MWTSTFWVWIQFKDSRSWGWALAQVFILTPFFESIPLVRSLGPLEGPGAKAHKERLVISRRRVYFRVKFRLEFNWEIHGANRSWHCLNLGLFGFGLLLRNF
uniref:Uncharacterized protein n=1 Tax=Rhizophora mucronata TaxID=61149 RepID=A0A2P2NSS7_RHIMU